MDVKIITLAALLAVGLALAVLAAGPVQRTTFKLAQTEAEEECRLASELQGVDGVLGFRLEKETGTLLVEHRPDVELKRLAQILAANGHDVDLLGIRRILPIHIHAFPRSPGGCGRHPSRGPRRDSWRALPDRRHH